MNKPKVTVVMPVMNGQKTIHKAIQSIVQQSFTDWELLICDDGSTDATQELIKSWILKDQRIQLIINQQNLGAAASRNICISQANGEYIALQDVDDYSDSFRLEKLILFLESKTDIAAVSCNAGLVDSNGISWGEISHPEAPKASDWVKSAQNVHAAAVIRKSVMLDIGCYDSAAKRNEDYRMWIRMLSRGYKLANLNETLYFILWDKNDYKRRGGFAGWDAFWVHLIAFQKLNTPITNLLWALKPLLSILIPNRLLFFYHKIFLGKKS